MVQQCITMGSTNSRQGRSIPILNGPANGKEEKPNKLSWVEKQIARIVAKKIYNELKPYIQMKSWRTTLAGAIGALGAYLVTVNDPAWLQIVGQVCIGLGMLLLGTSARDNKVTSEKAGAK